MEIAIYSGEFCPRCEKAKELMDEHGIRYTDVNAQTGLEYHEGWREDGSVEALAVYSFSESLPVFVVDGEGRTEQEGLESIYDLIERNKKVIDFLEKEEEQFELAVAMG